MVKRISGGAQYIFQKIAAGKPDDLSLNQGSRRVAARKWFRQQASEITQVDARRFMNNAQKDRYLSTVSHDNIGQMLMFWYDAKLKKELPYWDKLPMIFPIEIYGDGFLGINLHYLPPMYRASLMDALYTTISNDKLDRTTRMRINYSILKNARKFKLFKPCIKRYLNSHVQSKFIVINPDEWDAALMLPTERFQKQKKQVVWQESIKKVSD